MTAAPIQNGKDAGTGSLFVSTHSNSAHQSGSKQVSCSKTISPRIGHLNQGGLTDDLDYGHHQMLFLSPELDAAIGNILDVKNPLDTNMVSVVEYMNKVFPAGKIHDARQYVVDALIKSDRTISRTG